VDSVCLLVAVAAEPLVSNFEGGIALEVVHHAEYTMDMSSKLAIAALGVAAALGIRRRRLRKGLKGKTALVTGSSRGLGFLLAKEYASRGCKVVICSRDEGELAMARDALRKKGAEVLAIACDVSDEFEVRAMVEEITERFGGIDILVNNAGIIQVGPIEDQTLEDFEEALGVMFYGMLIPTWAALPQMLARGEGRIVNVTSIGGKVSVPHLLPYSAAKYAAVGLSQGLRAALYGRNITVTTAVPGLMRTGSYVNALFKGQRTREYAWFSVASSLPLITVSARRAARQIVDASQRGKAELTIGMPAKILAVIAGLFPGLTADVLGVVNRALLPAANGHGAATVPGKFVAPQLSPTAARVVELATTFGRRAGERYLQQ
jgi:NAD(P)-dependent dehydrogenase (short-subunit alcohol dehydrogenase family)